MDHNSIIDLVELLLRVAKADNGVAQTEVRVELRLNSADVDGDKGVAFNVGLKKVWLSLDLSGLATAPGTRHGEPMKSNQVEVDKTTTKENVVENQIRGGASLKVDTKALVADGSIDAGVQHNSGGKRTVSEKSSEKLPHIRVKARGGNNWEVSEKEGELLDGTYLNDEMLCRVTATVGANSQVVELSAYAKQKDILLKATKNGMQIPFLSNNHEKMMKILIAKALSANGSAFAGQITFSKSEIEVEE